MAAGIRGENEIPTSDQMFSCYYSLQYSQARLLVSLLFTGLRHQKRIKSFFHLRFFVLLELPAIPGTVCVADTEGAVVLIRGTTAVSIRTRASGDYCVTVILVYNALQVLFVRIIAVHVRRPS